MVFSYLSPRDLVRCHRVSRHWRATALSDSLLYRILDLTTARKPLTIENVKALVRYAGGDIKGLKMFVPTSTFSPGCFQMHLGRDPPQYKNHRNMHLEPLFRNLEDLEIVHTSGSEYDDSIFRLPSFPANTLRRFVVHGIDIHAEQIIDLCRAAPHLEELSCGVDFSRAMPLMAHFPSVKNLQIRLKGGMTPDSIMFDSIMFDSISFWDFFPNVEEFTFSQATPPSEPSLEMKWSHLKKLTLRNIHTNIVIIRSNELTTLELSDLPHLILFGGIAQPNLQHLCLLNLRNLNVDKYLVPLHNYASTLESLTFSSPQFEARHIEPVLPDAIHLQSLNINNLRYTSDATLQFLHHNKNLQHLSVDHCTGITGHGIIKLIENLCRKKGGKLTTISIRGNDSIRRQTVDWARAVGVEVSI